MSETKATSTRLYTPTIDLKKGRLRPGKEITYRQLEFIKERTAVGNYMCDGLIKDALQNGITLYKQGSDGDKKEKHDRNDEIVNSDTFEYYLKQIMKAEAHWYAYGWVVLALFEGASQPIGLDDEIYPRLEYFGWNPNSFANINYYTMDSAEGASNPAKLFEIESIDVKKIIQGQEQELVATLTDLDKTFVAMNHSDEHNKVIPPMLPIAEPLFELMANGSQAGLWVRRIGSGIHMILVDASLLSSKSKDGDGNTFEQDVTDWLDQLDEDSYFIGPKEINGVETEYKLYTGETSIDFSSPEQIQMNRISAQSAVPQEKLKGEPTAFKSTEAHQTNFFIQIEQVQKRALKKVKWLLKTVYNVEDALPEVNTYEEMTDKERTELNNQKSQGILQWAQHMERFGLTPQALFDWYDIDMEIDDSILQEFESRRQQLLQGDGTEQSDDREQEDESEEGEDGEQPGFFRRTINRIRGRDTGDEGD